MLADMEAIVRCVNDISVVEHIMILQSLNSLLNQIINSLKSLKPTTIMVVIILDCGVIQLIQSVNPAGTTRLS